jgi:DNA-binding transcriptional LysR family regulator
MKRDELGDLIAFLAVAEERSFTRAAARLGTSQSSLSHTVRRLEERLGVRLLTRTTRNVAPTSAGEQLADTLRPSIDDIEGRLNSITALRETPAGTIRLTSSRYAAQTILWPAVAKLLAQYPDLEVEISVDQRFTDIVTERFDAGVRLGDLLPCGPSFIVRVLVVHSASAGSMVAGDRRSWSGLRSRSPADRLCAASGARPPWAECGRTWL